MAGRIFVTSDFHFCHDRDFLYKPRGFDNVYDMNKTIIHNFNEVMDWNDTLYILGDIMLNNNEEGMNCLRQIPGRKYIIRGNHDTDTRVELYEEVIWDEITCAVLMDYNGYHFYLSHYPTLTSNFDYDKPLKRKLINLCGHTHTQDRFKDMDKGLIYHCELDAHNCYPVLIDDIIEDIKNYKGGI